MKKIQNLICILAVALLGFTTACHDDLSTLDVKEIPGVVVDTTGLEKLSVHQFDHLVVEPELELGSGLNESALSYKWRINPVPGDTVFQVIGTEKNLNYEVRFKPNVSGKYHLLYYTVTDNTTGLEYIMTWPLTVKNNIGEGLVIAETYDGSSTDISHIMHAAVTSEYDGISVKYKVYSAINGGAIPGLLKQMRFTKVYGVDALYGITDNSVVRVNTLDYTLEGTNAELFFGGSASFNPQMLGGVVQGDIYVGNGRLTGTYLGASKKYGLPFDFNYQVPDHVALNGFNTNPPIRISFYDEQNEHFVYLPTIMQFGDDDMHPVPGVTDGPFDPAATLNKRNLAAGVSANNDFLHLLQDKGTGEVALYVLSGGESNYPSPFPPEPKAKYSLAGAPDIENAKHFVFLDNQKVLYYATDTKIYAMLYSTGTPVFEARYTAPAGEQITTLQVYQQADYPFRSESWDPPYIATNNKQLIMSTYGTEGKVYLLPLINAGLGNIDAANSTTFSGFGKITAIATQL